MNDKLNEEQARQWIEDKAKGVSHEDLGKVLDSEKEIHEKLESSDPLKRFVEDCRLLVSIVRDYSTGTYRKIPYYTIAVIGAALLYILSPIDLIPDPIPVIGLADDALIIGMCLVMVEQELQTYKKWKAQASG